MVSVLAPKHSHPPLGDIIRNEGLVEPNLLETVLEEQPRSGGRLGSLLTAKNLLSPLALYQCLARQFQRSFANLHHQPCDTSLVDYELLRLYQAHEIIPWQRHDKKILVASTDITPETQRVADQLFAEPVELVLCTPRDFRHAIETLFGDLIEHDTRTRIIREMPTYTASYTTNRGQRQVIGGLLAMFSAMFILWPFAMFVTSLIVLNLFYFVTISFKLLLYYRQKKRPPRAHPPLPIDDADWPTYSILVPMYREEAGVPRLLAAIRELDYPKHRLDVKLVIEADDVQTFEAIKRAQPEPYFDIIRVPYSQPRTKPRACSYALNFVKGDFVTIYDAEDRPEPSQLKKAVMQFQTVDDDVICLQGRLNYYNWNETWLTRCFAIEYASLFDFMLPGLQSLDTPIPLGGTSNHIHLKKLRELGDWDPYNVTEDADLGIRMAMCGYRTEMLDSVTLEEAPITLGAWLKQRSRWIKGYMQTWLVYMRQPELLRDKLGARGFWGFHLFIGSPCLVFLLAPFLWLFSILWVFGVANFVLADWIMLMCYTAFAAGFISHLQLAFASIRRWRWRGMQGFALTYPFYWFLHSIASFKAFGQLLFRPHYWEKTDHCRTRFTQRDITAAIRQFAP